ncbi:hypothetical protein ARMGADRAFT_1006422 [Armillaria gallica]|uniref:Uncharacterized protein n=1 Tax=Armillaria gallica TaxID=47427 RepID=A0A2H3DYB4_ARMGA|nr:hypothetical protein ARMGADRAFT_1006422 [Armillaria gallica]
MRLLTRLLQNGCLYKPDGSRPVNLRPPNLRAQRFCPRSHKTTFLTGRPPSCKTTIIATSRTSIPPVHAIPHAPPSVCIDHRTKDECPRKSTNRRRWTAFSLTIQIRRPALDGE